MTSPESTAQALERDLADYRRLYSDALHDYVRVKMALERINRLLEAAEQCDQAATVGEIMLAEQQACKALGLPLVRNEYTLERLARMLREEALAASGAVKDIAHD